MTIKDAVTQQILVSNATGTSLNGQTFTSNRGILQIIWTSGETTSSGFMAHIWCGEMCQTFHTTITPDINPTAEVSNTYYDICNGTEINFSSSSEFYQNNVQYSQDGDSLTYDWGVIYPNNDTLLFNNAGQNFSHTFTENGRFLVFCNAIDSNGCLNRNNNTRTVRVSMPPTWGNVTSYPDSVCSGTQITLTGEPQPETWSEPISYNINTDTLFLPDGVNVCYNTNIPFNIFNEDATITSIDDIERIYLNIEYSFLGDLSIMIECPNGQKCLLKAYENGTMPFLNWTNTGGTNNIGSGGGQTIHLGLAPDPMNGDAADTYSSCYTIAGEGYSYNFTSTSPNPFGLNGPTTTISYTDPCGNTEEVRVLNEGDYATYESMSSLIGCPLNGIWTLYICDHLALDNGYLFEWGIFFTEDLYHDNMWSYSNSYPESSFSWSGEGLSDGISGMSSVSTIVQNSDPDNWAEIPYTFSATDNFGCTYDTTITVRVKPAMHEDCDSTVSMEGGQFLAEISILPNPANDVLTIKSSAQISHVEFVSIAGQIVSRINANSDNVVCNVADLEQGMYFVRIYGEDHKAPVVSKFVKN
jgi:subtilisin-like proprotein convertase family protein